MKCPNCEKELEEGAVFCPYCGKDIPRETEVDKAIRQEDPTENETAFCGVCGKKISASASCCPYCGTTRNKQNNTQNMGKEFEGYNQVNSYNQSYNQSYSYQAGKPRKKKGITGIIIAGICLAVLVIAAIVSINILRPAKQAFLYMKDSSHVYANQYKQGSDQRIDKESGVIWQYVSNDKKKLYYAVNRDSYDASYYDIYCTNLKKLKDMPERVARNVKAATFLKNNNLVYANTDNNLYLLSAKDEIRLEKNIREYYVANDEKRIFWIDSNRDLYVQELKANAAPQKISSGIQYISRYSADGSAMIAYKDDGYYAITDMMVETKMPSPDDIIYETGITDNGEVFEYYAKQADGQQISLYDFVEDDMFDQDQQITEPDEEQYSHTVLNKGFWGSYETTEVDDAYYDALDQYDEKVQRDNLREQLKQYTLHIDQTEVCYYSSTTGEQSLGVFNQLNYAVAYDTSEPYLALSYGQVDTTQKIKFSEVYQNGVNWAESTVSDRLNSNSGSKSWEIYVGSTSSAFNAGENAGYLSSIEVDAEHGRAYIKVGNYNQNGTYSQDVLVYDANNGGVTSYVEDVNSFQLCKGHTYYTMNELLYCDGNVIASNIEDSFYLDILPDSGKILLEEYVPDDGSGVSKYNLSIIEDNKIQGIERNVNAFEWMDEDRIVYMTDMTSYDSNGTLSAYSKGKTQRIARNIKGIVPMFDNYMGNTINSDSGSSYDSGSYDSDYYWDYEGDEW